MNDIVERIKDAENATHALFNHIFQDAREEIERLRAKIAEMEKQEPAGTLHDDGYFVWRKTAPHQSNYAGWKMALYALPGAHPKLESSVPDGWKLVPIEPTTEIRKAMHYAYWQSPQLPYHDGSPELWNAAYAAMLEAAP